MKENEKIIYIRTEANKTIATGHMMRCLSIADAAKEMGIASVFIVAEEVSRSMPEQRGYEVICLNHTWDDFDGEITVMTELIQKLKIEILLIDSYFVSLNYMDALKRLTKTAYIDDLHDAIWPCCKLINYAVYSDYFPYEEEYPDTQLILGSEYMPLRQEYQNMPRRILKNEVREVLLLTGGSDLQHFMKTAAELILEKEDWKPIHFTMVCGAFNTDLEELMKLAEDCGNHISVYPALPTLKEKLLEADIVVTAGGTTLYEMAACGTPGIVFQLADNQRWNVKAFTEKGLTLCAGELGNDFSKERLAETLEKLINNFELRKEMSERLQRLVDGQGANRIVQKLLEI